MDHIMMRLTVGARVFLCGMAAHYRRSGRSSTGCRESKTRLPGCPAASPRSSLRVTTSSQWEA